MPFVKEDYTHPRETAEGYCVFFDAKTKRCRVHSVKPETCVAGPITFDINVSKGRMVWYLKRKKICGLAGSLHHDEGRLCEHLKSAQRELTTLVENLPPGDLLSILRIPEPDTFKIGEAELNPKVLTALRRARRRKG